MRRWIVVCVTGTIVLGASIPPAMSTFPGGNGRIAYYDFLQSPRQIWSVDPDGTDPLELTTGRRSKVDPAWSADGSMIAFGSYGRNFDRGRLEFMNADGSGRTTIVAFPDHAVSDPAWSPDGSRIAFCRHGGRTRIWAIDVDGTDLVRLTGDDDACGPDWSPDGSTIAFASFGLWTMGADGSNPTELVVSTQAANAPTWSPDGTQIAFTRTRGRSNLFVVDADGTALTRLTSTPRRWEFTPAWSPDGARIAFCRGTGPSSVAPCEIWMMDPDGSNVTRVTTTPDVDEFALSWQPV